jgi:hypothetical protein
MDAPRTFCAGADNFKAKKKKRKEKRKQTNFVTNKKENDEERGAYFVSRVVRVNGYRGISQHRLNTSGCHDDFLFRRKEKERKKMRHTKNKRKGREHFQNKPSLPSTL